MEVVAEVVAFRKASVWYGAWTLRIAATDGQPARPLVSARGKGGPRLRRFRTANGLISFLVDLGLREACFPLKAGATSLLLADTDAETVAESETVAPASALTPETTPDAGATTSDDTPRMAAYITLTEAGRALHLLDLRNILSVADARLLVRVGWADPDPVRVATEDGASYLFEFVAMTLEGAIQLGELCGRIRNDDRPWGRCWNILDPIADLYCAPDEPPLVYHRGLLGRMTAETVATLHAGSAAGWPAAGFVDTGLGLYSAVLELHRAEIAQFRMSTTRIVETLDVVEHICPGVVAGAIDFAGCPFCLQRREEAFHCRVVPDVAGPAHRTGDAVVDQQALELLAGVLRPT